MTHRIALTFEDGVTRFIECGPGETVLDAAYRQRINLPMDCSDGVCGTCKCHAESGHYDLGDDYLEEALSADEAAAGQVLTCQMRPSSDCAIRVPVDASSCKTGRQRFEAKVLDVRRYADAAFELQLEVTGDAPVFLPGQYVNIHVPGTSLSRAYSFSSAPAARQPTFLIRRVCGGAMSAYLDRAEPGQPLELAGPLGSFYLREPRRPLLMLAGGTGLAPFLSMLAQLQAQACTQPVRLYYGVTRAAELVLVDRLQAYVESLPDFDFVTCVADPAAAHPRGGYVTDHLPATALHEGDVDVYVCGPPPMVDAVRVHFDGLGIVPRAFHYEKFAPTASASQGLAA